MAHFKRKRSRQHPSGNYSANGLARRIGPRMNDRKWTDSYPRWWDKAFHTKPKRARETLLKRAVLKGEDPDDMVWPDGRKPHIYYW
ncbi:hypothetical protein [Salipiger mucosus]|uniref:Uncharacterized protein n=1 Tax=Salipiger mucosus DSM 16094 TaxID=1123237 RepID=S9RVW7_9RHOB|nr:hypothetical protein [Salipiger mucosus]EPX78114.1 hypothetical protein Salmuc_03468 [Salipiger mucosus DSM 16094]